MFEKKLPEAATKVSLWFFLDFQPKQKWKKREIAFKTSTLLAFEKNKNDKCIEN